jgi:hypothetical protein
MRSFAEAWPAFDANVPQPVGHLPWGHIRTILDKRLEFLGLSGEVAERDLENALTSRTTETLRELGPGFSFVGRQVHFDVDGDDFYVDLLFFHIEQLRFNCTKDSLRRRRHVVLAA